MSCADLGTICEAKGEIEPTRAVLSARGRVITGQLQPFEPGTHHYGGGDAFELAPHLSSLRARRTPPRLSLQPRQHSR